MKKRLLSLISALLVVGNVFGAGYTRTLSEKTTVTGYSVNAFYNFQTNYPEVLPTSGDLRYRDGNIWGLHNFGSGPRSGTATISVKEGQLLVLQHYSGEVISSIDRGSLNASLTASTGYQCYDITTTADDVTFTIARYGGIVAALLMDKDESAATVNYTIQFENEDGATLKDPVTYTNGVVVGSSFTATAADMASFYNNEETIKYVYFSGNESKIASSAANENVITLVFKEYEKISYTITAKAGETTLSTIASGNAYADGSTTAYWSKYIKVDNQWYVSENPYGKVITEAGNTDVNYTASDISYFVEIENINKSRSAAAEVTGTQYSGGSSQRHYKNTQWWTDVIEQGGAFTLSFPYSMANSSPSTLAIQTRDSEGNFSDTGLEFTNPGSNGTSSLVVTIPSGSSLALTNIFDYNSNILIDYLTLTPTSSVPVTVSDAGFATFVSNINLDFSATDIEAYKVKVEEKGKAKLTKVNEVPAGTPVLLYAAGGATENIPVIASAAAVSDNDLVAGNGAAVATTDGDYTNMILNVVDDQVGFYFAADQTVAANRAYLHIATTLAPDAEAGAPMVIEFADEVTGIEAVEAETSASGIYNLAGQRVAKAQKGLYIVNGKKVIFK